MVELRSARGADPLGSLPGESGERRGRLHAQLQMLPHRGRYSWAGRLVQGGGVFRVIGYGRRVCAAENLGDTDLLDDAKGLRQLLVIWQID